MAGDSTINSPVQRLDPSAVPESQDPPPAVRLRSDGRVDTGVSVLDPTTVTGERMFSGGVEGYLANSGGTVQRLSITAPKAPALNTTRVSAEVAKAGASVIGSANRTVSNIDGAAQSGANQLLSGTRALDRITPIATVGLDVLDAAGRGLIGVTPRNAGLTSAVIATNRTIASLIPDGLDFRRTIDQPIVYDDKHGTRMLLQPGTTIVGQNGVVRLVSKGGYVSSNGVTVAASNADITVGKNGQKFLLDRFYVQDGKTAVDMRGIQTILGSNGALIARADSINVDLPHASVQVSGAQIASPDAHTLSAGFDQLAARSGSTAVNAGSTSLTSTTNGPTSTLAAVTNQLDVASGRTNFSVDTMTLSLSRNTANNTGALKWSAQGLHLDDGTSKIDAPAADLGLVKRADGSSVLGIRSRDLTATLGNQNWVTKGATTLALSFNPNGGLTDVSAKAADVSMTDPTKQLHAQGTYLHAAIGANGQISSIDGGTHHFDLAMQGRTLSLNNSRLDVTRDGDALVLKGTALNGRYSDGSSTFNLGRNGSIDARITQDAVHLTASASQFDFANKKSALAFTNGHVEAAFGSGVTQEYMRFNADHVGYTGTGASNQLTNLVADNAVASLTRDQNGSLALNLAGKNVAASIGGAQLGFTDVKNVDVITNAAGKITHIDAIMPGSSSYVSANGRDTIQVDNLQAHYSDTDQQRVRLSFDHGQVMLGTVSGEADGVKVSATANSLRAQIASGSASMNGVNVRLSDIPGQHIQLSAHTDANGVFSSARLVVPHGGDIQLSGKSFSANIGQSDTRLTQKDGVWRVDSRNFDINGTWKDVAVTADGKRFDAMVAGNQLILNHITGTNVNVRASGYNVNINVAQLDNLIANVTTVKGLAQGAAITLEPSKDNSHLTATISTVAAGIPIKLDIKDARAFEGLALVQPNQARLQLQDPTGKGYIKLAVGPLSIEGQGQIGAVATYHQFSEIRMAQDAARMGAGYDVTPNLRISPDGAFTLHTNPRNTALYASGTFLAPIDPPYPWQDPTQIPYQNNLVPTEAPGFIGRLGVQREVTDKHGHTKTQAAFVYGGVTGSSRTALDVQGTAKLFGVVPLPNHADIPTELQAGVGFENGHWRGTVGGHANPGALHSQYVVDPHPYGGDLGLNYTAGTMSVDAGVTVDRRDAGVGPGAKRAGFDAAALVRFKIAF